MLLLVSGLNLAGDVLYSVTDLGALGGIGYYSAGYGINNAGQVTGLSAIEGNVLTHAFLYSNGQMTDLGTLGGPVSTGYSINNVGQVIGIAGTATGASAFLYSNGQITDLGIPGTGHDINDAGQVAGDFATGNIAPPDGTIYHAFLYSNGQMTDLGTLGGLYSAAFGINNAGQVTGSSQTATGSGHPFLYSKGQMTDLGTLGLSSYGVAINDAGQVAGNFYGADYISHAFLYSNGQMTDLGTLRGGPTEVASINIAGQVVGDYAPTFGVSRPFLYSNGQMTDLNDLIDPALGVTFYDAAGINDKGQIVANGMVNADYEGYSHAYLLTPIPEPQALSLLAGGLAGILALLTIVRRART